MKTNNISLMYSYHAKISGSTTLSAGFQFSYLQRQLNANQFFGDMIDELYDSLIILLSIIIAAPTGTSPKLIPSFANLIHFSI